MLKIFLSIALLVAALSVNGQPPQQGEASFANNRNGDEARVALAAAKDGNYLAQYHIGTIYAVGYAGNQNFEQAAYWFRRSAESNYAQAQHSLAHLYLLGRGVPRDFSEAARLERLAALQGDAYAQVELGRLYKSGYGVEKDFVRAYMWYEVAATNANGMQPPFDKDAAALRDGTAKLLSPEQLLEAKKLADDCRMRKIQECK